MAEASTEVPPEKEERRAAIVLSPDDVSTLAEQLNDVAGKWELFLGLLKVSPAKQEQIKSSRANHPAYAQICLVDGLQHWVVSDPSPTVEKVIAALSSRTINNKLLAEKIARKWGIQAFVENPAPELRSICTAASELAITRPESQLLFDKLQAEAKSSELRKRFISLVNHLKRHLKESITDAGLSKFREEFILELPFSVREENEKFFNRNNTEINKATTFDELFTCLSTYWSYLNHSLLGGIILRYGTEELKDNIKAFSRGVDEFRSVITVEVFQEIEPSPRVDPPAGFEEFVTKHALSLTSTLEDIECIRHKFCEKFHLHKFAFYLVRVLKGSVLITWLVPHSVARLVEAGMTQELMRELSIEDIILYTNTKSSSKKDDATPIIEPSTPVSTSAAAKASANEDPTVPAVMVSQSVGVEVAAPRFQKTLDRVAIALLVLASTQFVFLRWVSSIYMNTWLQLIPIIGPFLARVTSFRWFGPFSSKGRCSAICNFAVTWMSMLVSMAILIPLMFSALEIVGIYWRFVLDLVLIEFEISSVNFMSAMVCVSALACLSTRYQRLREVDSLPAVFKDAATFASCVSVVYLAGVCTIIAILAHTMILDGGWISLIYFPTAVVFVAYSLLILMLFLHTCVSKRRLFAAWLLLTVALLAACYLMVNYLSVHPWIVTSINILFMTLRADFVVLSGDEISYFLHLFEVSYDESVMVIWMLVAAYASGVASYFVVKYQKLTIVHFFMIWPILFWYAYTFVFCVVLIYAIAAYVTDPFLSVWMVALIRPRNSKIGGVNSNDQPLRDAKETTPLGELANVNPQETPPIPLRVVRHLHSHLLAHACDAIAFPVEDSPRSKSGKNIASEAKDTAEPVTQTYEKLKSDKILSESDSLGPEAVYASVECTPEDSEVPMPSTHSDTATAPTEECVPVVPATPGEGNQDPADTATAEAYIPVASGTKAQEQDPALPAMMVPVGVGGAWGWLFGKWQGLIVLIALLTYLQINGVHPFYPTMSLWNPLVAHHGGAQLPLVPCSFDEDACLTPISSEIELNRALAVIADWYALCQHLGVSEAKLEELKFSSKHYATKKRECLSAYFDLGSQVVCWERVVEVVGTEPFENVRLAERLSRRFLGCDYNVAA